MTHCLCFGRGMVGHSQVIACLLVRGLLGLSLLRHLPFGRLVLHYRITF
jgi:hypothetical protein